jgi:hypothetical protein
MYHITRAEVAYNIILTRMHGLNEKTRDSSMLTSRILRCKMSADDQAVAAAFPEENYRAPSRVRLADD